MEVFAQAAGLELYIRTVGKMFCLQSLISPYYTSNDSETGTPEMM